MQTSCGNLQMFEEKKSNQSHHLHFPDSRPSQHQDHKKTILLSQTLHNCFLFIKDQSKKIEISKVFNFSFIHSLPVYPKQISFSNCINICKLEVMRSKKDLNVEMLFV